MQLKVLSFLAALTAFATLTPGANAGELKISREALERTIKSQLFSGPQGRYYVLGNDHSPCYVYADSPSVTFTGERIVVRVHTSARIGAHLPGTCIGISLTPTAAVSMVPDAEGESIGFRDARIESVSDSSELNFLLLPFLSHKIPISLKVNAANMFRQLLAQSFASTGYIVTLEHLKIQSMTVESDHLLVDLDGDLSVN